MIKNNIPINGSKVLILGITFKENCPDVRNTKVIDVVTSLQDYGSNVSIYDPWANVEEVFQEYKLNSTQQIPNGKFDALVLTVAHSDFQNINFKSMVNQNHVIYDVKNSLPNPIKHGCL